MPKSFVQTQNKNITTDMEDMITKVSNMDLETAQEVFEQFALQNKIVLELHDQSGSYINSYGVTTIIYENGNMILQSNNELEESEYQFSRIDVNEFNISKPDENNSKIYPLMIENNNYMLSIMGANMENVNQVVYVLKSIIVWVILFMTLLSFVIAWFLAWFITKPIKKINAATKEIANFSFDYRCEENRFDELGELAKNINMLSLKLDNALTSLKLDLEKEKELEEKQRIFFQSASHELKTPLTIIKGNLEGMAYGYKEFKDKDAHILKSLRVVNQMQKLINDILIISEMSDKNCVINCEKVDLKKLIEGVLKNYEEMIELKQFDLIQSLDENHVSLVDKKMFIKAIQNIINNAFYYSPEKEKIYIILTASKIMIKNTGTNIEDSEISKVFLPFYRIEKSHNRQTGGSGLGLYFVKKILDEHQFDFTISNEKNSVVFTINFSNNINYT